MRTYCLAFTAFIILSLIAPRSSEAAVFLVTNNADSGAGSLRSSVAQANATAGPDSVFFTVPVGSITLTSGEIVVTEQLEIIAATDGQVISGNNASRIFRSVSGASLSLVRLVLQDGRTTADTDRYSLDCGVHGPGGAVCAMGPLTLSYCSIVGNSVTGRASDGGGVFAGNTLSLEYSLISGNSATDLIAIGGGLHAIGQATVTNSIIQNNSAGVAGGMSASGPSTITNSTISGNRARTFQAGGLELRGNSTLTQTTVSGNSAAGGGGGIHSQSNTLQIFNSTITKNSSSDGAGGLEMYNYQAPSLTTTLFSSILADNQGTLGNFNKEVVNNGGAIQINSNASLFGDAPAEINGTATNTLFDNAPILSDLIEYGCAVAAGAGSTATCVQVHAPNPSSPARDSGGNAVGLATDQRGAGFVRTIGAGTDMGAVEAQGRILTIAPNPLDFGYIPAGSSASQDVTLTNAGTLELKIYAITSPVAPMARSGGTCTAPPFGLAAGASCTLQYTFSPPVTGVSTTGSIQVTSDTSGAEIRTLNLRGNTLEAMLVLSPDPLDFGEVPAGSITILPITISNPGTAPLQISAVTGQGAPFLSFGGAITVAPGGIATRDIIFQPTATGSFSQDLTLTSNAVGSPDNILTLQGVAIEPSFVSASLLDFGDVRVDTHSIVREITLFNPLASRPVIFTDLTIPSAPFVRAGGTCSALPIQLVPAESCTIGYRFSPTAVGGASENVTATFYLQGSGVFSVDGISPPAAGSTTASAEDPSIIQAASPDGVAPPLQTEVFVLQGTGVAPSLALMPDPLDFGDVLAGSNSATLSVTVSNPGTSPLNVTAITAALAPFTSIAGGSCGAVPFTVDSSGNCTLSYRFSPTAIGNASQDLTVSSDAGGTADNIVTLQGVGVEPPLTLSPDPLDFGETLVGTDSATLSVDVTNSGTTSVTIIAINTSGDFTQPAGSCIGALLAGSTCNIPIVFTPTDVGIRLGQLQVQSASSTRTVELRGTGVDYALDVTVAGEGSVSAAATPTPNSGVIASCTSTGDNCSARYSPGAMVALTPTPLAGWRFAGWSGDSACNGGLVAINADTICNATFLPNSISGGVAGLNGDGMTLHLDFGSGDEDLLVNGGSTSLAFSAAIPAGATYTVTVSSQPTNPSQTCSIANGTGTMPAGVVSDLFVYCGSNSYQIGGTVAGLTTSGLILSLNGGNDLAIAMGSTDFAFDTLIPTGSSYSVAIAQQASGEICALANASGTVDNANVTDVVLTCAPAQAQLDLAITDGAEYARYGQIADYLVTLSNYGNMTAVDVPMASIYSAGLDVQNSSWICIPSSPSAQCAMSGTGAFIDTVSLPAKQSISWLVSVPIFPNSNESTGELAISADGDGFISDIDTLVIFRTGFDQTYGDGAMTASASDLTSAIIDGDTMKSFILPAPTGLLVNDVLGMQADGKVVRVQQAVVQNDSFVRLLVHSKDGHEHSSSWVQADPLAELTIASTTGQDDQRIILLQGAALSVSMPLGK